MNSPNVCPILRGVLSVVILIGIYSLPADSFAQACPPEGIFQSRDTTIPLKERHNGVERDHVCNPNGCERPMKGCRLPKDQTESENSVVAAQADPADTVRLLHRKPALIDKEETIVHAADASPFHQECPALTTDSCIVSTVITVPGYICQCLPHRCHYRQRHFICLPPDESPIPDTTDEQTVFAPALTEQPAANEEHQTSPEPKAIPEETTPQPGIR